MKRIGMGKLLTFSVFFSLVLLVACSNVDSETSSENDNESSASPDETEVIKVGLQAPMTGDNAQYGEEMKNGIELAFTKINNDGGVNGKKLELVVGDDKATTSEAVAVVNKMINNDYVRAVMGGYNSSPTIAAQEVSGQAEVIHLHMGASPELSTIDNDYLFRNLLTGSTYVPAVLEYMAKEAGIKKVVSLYENTDYGVTMYQSAQDAAKSLGIEFIANETYNPGDKNFSSQLTKIKSLEPDAVMIVGLYNEVALISQQAEQAGLDVQFFSPDDSMYSEQLINLGGDSVNGHIFASMLNLEMDTEEMNEFKELAEENDVPVEALTAIAYDGAVALAQAFEEGGDSNEAVREALENMDINGVTGPIKFDENGDRSYPPLIMQVENGEFVIIQN